MLLNLELAKLDPKNHPFIKLECREILESLLIQMDLSDNVSAHWFDNNYLVIEESPYAQL